MSTDQPDKLSAETNQAATGGVRNSGQMGNVQTGSGLQLNATLAAQISNSLVFQIIAPSIGERQDAWVREISAAIETVLGEHTNELTPQRLAANEAFVTAVATASQITLRTHQQEKREALRNAVLNTALPNAPDEDLQLMFFNYIDIFTPWHLRILGYLDKRWRENRLPEGTPFLGEHEHFMLAYPEMQGRERFFNLINNDLTTRGLINVEIWLRHSSGTKPLTDPFLLDMGEQFLRFITSPLAEQSNQPM